MKRAFSIILILIISGVFAASFSPQKVRALPGNSAYGRALKDGIILYSDKNTGSDYALFELTKTYYVYIVDKDTPGDFYAVEYQTTDNGYAKIYGYVKKTDIAIWTETVSTPLYPYIYAAVSTTSDLTHTPSSATYTGSGQEPNTIGILHRNNQLICYGKIYNEAEDRYFYYVRRNVDQIAQTGYFAADNLSVTLPDAHPDPMPTPTPSPSPSLQPSSEGPGGGGGNIISGGDDTLQILLIAAICVPALIVVYLMFKPSKGRRGRYKRYYDDEDDM